MLPRKMLCTCIPSKHFNLKAKIKQEAIVDEHGPIPVFLSTVRSTMLNLKGFGQIVFKWEPKECFLANNLVTMATSFQVLAKLTMPHCAPPHVHVHTKFEETWSESFQMGAKRMFFANNLVTMATSFESSSKLTMLHCAPAQCACPYQI